jgi:hypothetical protein
MRNVRVAHASLWAAEPTAEDMAKARAYAAKNNGFMVVHAESKDHARAIALEGGAA